MKMNHQKHQIRVPRGCLLIWIAVSMVYANDPVSAATETTSETTPTTTSVTTPTTALGTTAEGRADMPAMGNTDGLSNTTPIIIQARAEQPAAADAPSLQNSCPIFQCMGNDCYKTQPASTGSANTTCPNYCETFRYNHTYYEVKCSDHCMHHMCLSMEAENCSVQCCNSLTSCSTSEENMEKSTPAMPTTVATTITYSDKKCRSFVCSGADCLKNQAAAPIKRCRVGITHCELHKQVTNGAISYEGGCSNTCATSTKSCASITNGNCFQECCIANNTACCMKLDGQVHFNGAAQINKSSAFKMFTCAIIVLFLSRYFSFSRV